MKMAAPVSRTYPQLLFCIFLLAGLLVMDWAIQPAIAQVLRPADPKPKDDDSWEVIYIDGTRIGYSRNTTHTIRENGRETVRSENETHLSIKRFGQTLNMQTHLRIDENDRGEVLGYEFSMKNPPANSTTTKGTVNGDRLTIETTVAGRVQEKTIAWDRDVKSPVYQEKLLSDPPIKSGETRTFKTFLPEFNKVTDVRIHADGSVTTELMNGKRERLLRVRVTQAFLPTMTTRVYVDDEGNTLKSESDFLGTQMITYTVPKDVALEAIAGEELDIAVNTLVHVDRIRDIQQKKQAVYRIVLDGDDPTKYISTAENQTVKKVGDGVAEVTVAKVEIPASARYSRVDNEYTAATQFLQSHDPKVVEHANRAAAGEVDLARIARNMEKYVHKELNEKNFSTALASAAEVAESLEGDCTEHAVLLAAMLRAKRIPSRVAVGMVYVDRLSSFGGHMWTEAYLDGKWIPLDATMGLGGIGVGHIKLAESSLADDAPAPVTSFLPLLNLLGKMEIEVVETK